MINVIVTGATSMIGVATIKSFIHESSTNHIYAVVRHNSPNLYKLPKSHKIIIIECSADNYCNLINLINEKCDLFYHFAWLGTGHLRNEDIKVQVNNIRYSLDAIMSAKKLGCSKFIGSGSQAEYGPLNDITIGPTTPCSPVQPYGIAKYATGLLLLQEAKKNDIDCFWVRVFSVYGINDKKETLVNYAIDCFYNNKPSSFSSGEQMWDYLFEDDCGRAFYLIGKYSIGYKTYCLASGDSKTIKEYLIDIKNIVNREYTLNLGGITSNIYPPSDLVADISLLKRDTGFEPKTSFIEGINIILKKRYGAKRN